MVFAFQVQTNELRICTETSFKSAVRINLEELATYNFKTSAIKIITILSSWADGQYRNQLAYCSNNWFFL